MKTEDNSVVFALQQSRKSGSSITCDFLLTNKGADRQFTWVTNESKIFDELGNSYEGTAGQIANQTGRSKRISFISGVITKAQMTFDRIEPEAAKITLLRVHYDVGDKSSLDINFRNVPLVISK